jgi:hypothetical protein
VNYETDAETGGGLGRRGVERQVEDRGDRKDVDTCEISETRE